MKRDAQEQVCEQTALGGARYAEIQRRHSAQGQKIQPLSDCQKRRNQRLATQRAKVKHPFARISHMGGKFVRSIGRVEASATITLMADCYNLKLLASFLDNKVDPFFKPAPSKRQLRLQPARG